VDAFGYYLGSLLSEYLLTPFFPLLYSCFRAFDQRFFDEDTVEELSPSVNRNFPVEAVIMQPLRENLNQIVDREGFFVRDGDRSSGYSEDKIMSMFAQVVFGLTVAQKVFGIVNNDFHGGNLMYQQVPPNSFLYYHAPHLGLYWRVPTFGRVFKMIDFGRASFNFDNIKFTSPMQDQKLGGGLDLYNFNNDLYKITSIFIYNMGWSNYLRQIPEHMQNMTDLLIMFDAILDCGGQSVFTELRKCERPTLPLVEQVEHMGIPFTGKACHIYALHKWPYVYESTCDHAVPNQNLAWFTKFLVDQNQIPEDAVVYLVAA
jgi:hypothetical protein